MHKYLLPAKLLTSPVLTITGLKYVLLILTYSLCFLYLSLYSLINPTPSITWPTPEVIQLQRTNIVSALGKIITRYVSILAESAQTGAKKSLVKGNVLPGLPLSSNNESKKPDERLVYPHQLLFNQGSKSGAKITLIVELKDEPAVEAYVKEQKIQEANQNSTQAVQLATDKARLQLNQIEKAQLNLIKQLQTDFQAAILDRTQRVSNSIIIEVEANRVEELRKLPEVKDVHPVQPYYKSNSSAVSLVGAVSAWEQQSGGLALTGEGVKIGVVDSGIDYLHTDFGGPGTPSSYANNNPTVITDTLGVFPGTKVAGGYDFVGDSYDGLNRPLPDPDPMDCGDGHGTHVAGTLAGYGVNSDGTTYTGVYNSSIVSANLSIGPGVAPKARLYALKVFGCSGSTSSYAIIQALEWSIDPNRDGDFADRLDVLNLSLGSDFGSPYDPTAIAANYASLLGVIVVASAGNAGDNNSITSSPANADRAISVASSVDRDSITGGFLVTNPPMLTGQYPSAEASFGYNLASGSLVTGTLGIPLTSAGLKACADFATTDTNAIAGKIVLLERGDCSFKAKAVNAQQAGAKGILVYNDVAGADPFQMSDDATISTPVTIPLMMTNLATANIFKNSFQLSPTVPITVVFTAQYRATHRLSDPARVDTLSVFSSRGPRRGDSMLKPDITAPGDTVFSAKLGSSAGGTRGISYSGTSMASPLVAGSAALLRQLHPNWTVDEIKAALLNTAGQDLRVTTSVLTSTYGLARVGAGRLDVSSAVSATVIAYAENSQGRVNVSFGSLEVATPLTLHRLVRVINKGTESVSYLVSYASFVDAPGVEIVLSTSSLTLAGGESRILTITLTADPDQLRYNSDTTIASEQAGQVRGLLSEESGYLVLTPVAGGNGSSATGNPSRLAIHAAPRPATTIQATVSSFNFGDLSTVISEVKLSGSSFTTATHGFTPLVTALELQHSSPDEASSVGIVNSADLRYVGITSDYNYRLQQNQDSATAIISNTTLYFGIATWSAWSTLHSLDTEFVIYIDTNNDGVDDYRLFTRSYGQVWGKPGANDVFVARLCPLVPGDCVTTPQPLNGDNPLLAQTALLNSNVVLLPVRAADLNLSSNSSRISYRVVSYSRDYYGIVDNTPRLYYDLATPGLTFNLTTNLPFGPDVPDSTISFTYNKAAYRAASSEGLLLFHYYNQTVNRVEVVTLQSAGTVFNSVPVPGSLIDIGSVPMGKTATATLSIFSNEVVAIKLVGIIGENPNEFSVVKIKYPFSNIENNYEVIIGCKPQEQNIRKAVINILIEYSNLTNKSLFYELNCEGVIPFSQNTGDENWHWTHASEFQANDLTQIACLDQNRCYSIGINVIVASVDAGNTWYPVYFYPELLNSLECTNLDCYVVGTNGLLLRSTDNISEWEKIEINTNQNLLAMECPTVSICYIISKYSVYLTTNNGITWSYATSTPSPTSGYSLQKISCINSNNCLLLGNNWPSSSEIGPSVLQILDQNIFNIKHILTYPQSNYFYDIDCFDTGLCIIFGEEFNWPTPTMSFFLTTNDAGKNWVLHKFSFVGIGGIESLDCPAFNLCYVANDFSVKKYHNINQEWLLESEYTNPDISFNSKSIYCLSEIRCLVTGVSDQIFLTIDGNENWLLKNGRPTISDKNYSYISCPDVLICFSVGKGTISKTTDGGKNWDSRFFPSVFEFAGIDCPTNLICYAIARSYIYKTQNGGISWEISSEGPLDFFNNIQCPSATNCYTLGVTDHYYFYFTNDGGSTWLTKVISNSYIIPTDISCPSVGICYIVGWNGYIFKTIDSGNTWIDQTAQTVVASQLKAISCLTSSYCYIAGEYGRVLYTEDGGNNWLLRNLPTEQTALSISCSQNNLCYVVNASNNIFLTTNFGISWEKQTPGTLASKYIQCPDAHVCYLAVEFGILSNQRQLWNKNNVLYENNIKNATCLTPSDCIAVGLSGTILISSDGGSTWITSTSPTTNDLYGVGCGSTCVAVGYYGTIITSTDKGVSWGIASSGTTHTLYDVGCGSTCVAVGYYGTILVSEDNGKTWQNYSSASITHTLYGVGCGSTCVAVGYYGTILVSEDGGKTWVKVESGTQNTLRAVTCGITCVAVGDYGTLLISKDGGKTWELQETGTLSNLNSITCGEGGACYVAGAYGTILTGNGYGKSSWNRQASSTLNSLNTVTCNSSFCLAGGNQGTLVTRIINGYKSSPEAGSTIAVGNTTVGTPVTASLTIFAPSRTTLTVSNPLISGTNVADFKVISPNFPINLAPGTANNQDVTIRCIPTSPGSRVATLTLSTSDPARPTVSYPLSCTGFGTATPGYDSVPTPGNPVEVGSVYAGGSVTTTLVVREAGGAHLVVSNPLITGSNTSDFSLISPTFPISIPNGSAVRVVTIQCTPSLAGSRVATLTLSTNDPTRSQVVYPLSCLGLRAGYDSVPPPGSKLVVGNALVGAAVTTTLVVRENGNSTLIVTNPEITGPHSQDFSVIAPGFPFTVLNGRDGQPITVRCIPGEEGLRLANLLLHTSDPSQPIVTYALECGGGSNTGSELVVDKPLDNGLGTVKGTFSYALATAVPGQTIRFALGVTTTLTVLGKLPPVPVGVNISAPCQAGSPTITIDGSQASPGEHGLILKGRNSVQGLTIEKFSGMQLAADAGGNSLSCVKIVD